MVDFTSFTVDFMTEIVDFAIKWSILQKTHLRKNCRKPSNFSFIFVFNGVSCEKIIISPMCVHLGPLMLALIDNFTDFTIYIIL